MEVKPLRKKVLIAENKTERKTDSGIILEGANSVRESLKATVLAVGPDVTAVRVGDVIILEWHKASVIKVGDAQRAMIDEDNIIAVVE